MSAAPEHVLTRPGVVIAVDPHTASFRSRRGHPGLGRGRSAPGRGQPSRLPATATLRRRLAWAASGGLCGKYLAAAMGGLLTALEHHDELVCGQRGYSDAVGVGLWAMLPAMIDRCLTEARGLASCAVNRLRSRRRFCARRSRFVRLATRLKTSPDFFRPTRLGTAGRRW